VNTQLVQTCQPKISISRLKLYDQQDLSRFVLYTSAPTLPRRWPGIWLNASTDYVCTGNFLLKRHPFTIPFLDLWINSGDVVPELKPFHTWFSWEQRPLNALVGMRTLAPGAHATILVSWSSGCTPAPQTSSGLHGG